MKINRKLLAVLGLMLIVGLFASPVGAQTPTIVMADVDRTTLTTDDTLNLTISIDESLGKPGQPLLPPLDGFQVIGSSRGTQMSIVNGSMSVKTTYSFRLSPIQAGSFVIEPVVVPINGQAFASQPVTIEVVQGNGRPTSPQSASPFGSLFPSIPGFPSMNFPSFPNFPSMPNTASEPSGPVVTMDPALAPAELAGQEYYLESRVSNPNPYHGEQLIHTLRLYQPGNAVFQPEYEAPGFSGFWSQAEEDQKNLSLQYAGRNYRVLELNTILIPTVIGDITVDSAAINLPGSFFSSGRRLISQPINMNVIPLPESAPATFSGAIGQFELSSESDTFETTVNEAVTAKLIISGVGNIETMGDPDWPELPGWRAFETQATTETQIENGLLMGTRQYNQILVPTEPGLLSIPAFIFTYFDTDLGEYITKTTGQIPIKVESDGQASPPPLALPASTGGSIQDDRNNDIRPLKNSPDTWTVGDNLLLANINYWLIWIVPLMMLVLYAAWQFRQQYYSANIDTLRSRGAHKQAIKALNEAKRDNSDDSQQVGPILIRYLEEKLNRSLSGFTNPAIAKLLKTRGVNDVLIDRFQNTLFLSEMGRFSPESAAGAAGDIIKVSKDLVKDLDRVL